MNSIPSVAMSYMSQREDMRKIPFWDFWFNRLWPFNFMFGCQPKSLNHNNLVSTHPIWKLKIVSESSRSRESMVRNPFLDFECLNSRNPCHSSTSPRANSWPVTPKKFLRHGFSFFHLNILFSPESWSRWHFAFLIEQTPHPASNNHLELKLKIFLSYEEELVFGKIPSVESILSQFFIQFQFHVQI